jgi:hypothetical protein
MLIIWLNFTILLTTVQRCPKMCANADGGRPDGTSWVINQAVVMRDLSINLAYERIARWYSLQ